MPRAVAPPDRQIGNAIGQTPLVRLRRFEPHDGVEIYAKLESRNPGGSVKDRAALAMIREGERTGALGPGRILLDATSGNTGIAYAMLAAARGYRVQLCVPANVTVSLPIEPSSPLARVPVPPSLLSDCSSTTSVSFSSCSRSAAAFRYC
jgi:threonine dehydratase